jgi:hypothetical protein
VSCSINTNKNFLICECACGTEFVLKSVSKTGDYMIKHYGEIDKVTGRCIEMSCPLCRNAVSIKE